MFTSTRRARVLGLSLVAAAAVGLLAAPAAHGAAQNLGSTLTVGQRIPSGSYLSNGAYQLTMQTNGDLVLRKSGTAIWASDTTGSGLYALFGSGGELAVWNSNGTKLWHTLTYGRGTKVALLADGDLDVYDGSAAIWGTHTYGGRNELDNSRIYSKALSLVGKYDYVFGGGHGPRPGPTVGSTQTMDFSANGNLDCSGFVRYVYYLASGQDIMNAATDGQIDLANHHDDYGAPGSLIFYSDSGSTNDTHHVGVYGGNGQLINEWDSGHKTLINGVGDSSGTQFKYYWRSW